MKPAPPVTSNLAMFHLLEHAPQPFAPVNRRKAHRSQGRFVQYTVRRPACGGWIVLCGNWNDGSVVRSQVELSPLLCNRDREVVPARNAGIGPVVDSSDFRHLDDLPKRLGKSAGRGRS